MALFTLETDALQPVLPTDFATENLKERADLQRLLRDRPDALGVGLLVVAEEYGEWEESKRRIDLLALDPDANIVVIELKRTKDDVFMDLQAIRYAALVSELTFQDLVDAHERYLANRGISESGRARLFKFLEIENEEDAQIGLRPRIILVAPSFSIELTTSVIWLNDQGVNLKCVEMNPYKLGADTVLDFTQVIPSPQATDYQVKILRKTEAVRVAQQRGRRERTVQILKREGKIRPGDVITLLPSAVGRDSLDTDDSTYRASFAEDISRQKNVIWERDQNLYSLSTLCENMRDVFGEPLGKGSINGYRCWALEGSTKSLWELAEETTLEPPA